MPEKFKNNRFCYICFSPFFYLYASSLFPSPDIWGRKDWGLVFHSEIWEPGLYPDLETSLWWETNLRNRGGKEERDRKQNSSLEVFRRRGTYGELVWGNLLSSIGMVPGCWLWHPISSLKPPTFIRKCSLKGHGSLCDLSPSSWLIPWCPMGHLLEGKPPSGEQKYSHWIAH